MVSDSAGERREKVALSSHPIGAALLPGLCLMKGTCTTESSRLLAGGCRGSSSSPTERGLACGAPSPRCVRLLQLDALGPRSPSHRDGSQQAGALQGASCPRPSTSLAALCSVPGSCSVPTPASLRCSGHGDQPPLASPPPRQSCQLRLLSHAETAERPISPSAEREGCQWGNTSRAALQPADPCSGRMGSAGEGVAVTMSQRFHGAQ